MKFRRHALPPDSHIVDKSPYSVVLLVHGMYYIVSGLWPVVSPGSFQLITGPKRDMWLVKAMGLLIAAVGASFTLASRRQSHSPEVFFLGVSSAAVLSGVDVTYYRKGILRWVYLGDAALELGLLAGWLIAWRGGMKRFITQR